MTNCHKQHCQLGQFLIFAEKFTPESTLNPGLSKIELAALYSTLLVGTMVLLAVMVLLLLNLRAFILEPKSFATGAKTKLLEQSGNTFTVILLEYT